MTTLLFSHGNSFPASTYRVMLDSLRARGFAVHAIEKYGHHPDYPVTDNWPHLVRQLADFARSHCADGGPPPWLVGHSLGGILSLLCAAQHPDLASGVVVLDSPIVGGWRAHGFGLAKRSPKLMQRLSPSQISRRRRNDWEDREAVFAYFRSKKVFSTWDAQVLHDYVDHGTIDADGRWRLAFDPEVESSIYDSFPHRITQLLRQQPLKCPMAFIGGLQSTELRQAGGPDSIRRMAKGRVMMIEGTHLFPMEKPLAAAAAVEASLRAATSG
ncbi:alpha/beta fold hydrolase [Ottowia sp.]|uniref:alpha/beta fold hydrolase n=1 Tax=Ottowia sp. TaxID=1898956 RepID=UPI003A89B4AD